MSFTTLSTGNAPQKASECGSGGAERKERTPRLSGGVPGVRARESRGIMNRHKTFLTAGSGAQNETANVHRAMVKRRCERPAHGITSQIEQHRREEKNTTIKKKPKTIESFGRRLLRSSLSAP